MRSLYVGFVSDIKGCECGMLVTDVFSSLSSLYFLKLNLSDSVASKPKLMPINLYWDRFVSLGTQNSKLVCNKKDKSVKFRGLKCQCPLPLNWGLTSSVPNRLMFP